MLPVKLQVTGARPNMRTQLRSDLLPRNRDALAFTGTQLHSRCPRSLVIVPRASAAEPAPGLKVLVAGATGGVGKKVVEQLAASGVPVRALVRDASKLAPTDGVEVVTADVFQFATLPPAIADSTAIVVATGASDRLDPFGPFNVDYQGTVNLVEAAKQKGVKKFVLVSSIGADDPLHPLNLFYGVLFWKKRGEEALQRSGLDYTIVRPGGLLDQLKQGESPGNVVLKPANFYGMPPKESGSVLRSQVAEVSIHALTDPAASGKVVELVARSDAPALELTELFQSVTY